MKNLYEKLKAKIIDNNDFTTANLKPIKSFEIYKGQYEAPENFELFDTPAIFVDWNISWDKNAKNKTGTLNLNLHIIVEDICNDISMLDYYDTINSIVENTETQFTGKLKLISEGNSETGILNVYMMNYEASIRRTKLINSANEIEVDSENIGVEIKKYDIM